MQLKKLEWQRLYLVKKLLFLGAWLFCVFVVVKFLIENGANKEYKNQNGLGLLECSERVEKQFKDSSLKEFMENNQ